MIKEATLIDKNWELCSSFMIPGVITHVEMLANKTQALVVYRILGSGPQYDYRIRVLEKVECNSEIVEETLEQVTLLDEKISGDPAFVSENEWYEDFKLDGHSEVMAIVFASES